jgi:hypothetical protein
LVARPASWREAPRRPQGCAATSVGIDPPSSGDLRRRCFGRRSVSNTTINDIRADDAMFRGAAMQGES